MSNLVTSYFTVFSNDDLIIDYTTEEGDKNKDSRSFGNSHAVLIYATVSKITISPKHAEQFKIIAARIYSTETEIEIPLLEETVVRLGFLMELKLSINMILINHWCSVFYYEKNL